MKIKKGHDAIVLPEVIDADTAQVIFYSDDPKTNPNAVAIMLYRAAWKDFCEMRAKTKDAPGGSLVLGIPAFWSMPNSSGDTIAIFPASSADALVIVRASPAAREW